MERIKTLAILQEMDRALSITLPGTPGAALRVALTPPFLPALQFALPDLAVGYRIHQSLALWGSAECSRGHPLRELARALQTSGLVPLWANVSPNRLDREGAPLVAFVDVIAQSYFLYLHWTKESVTRTKTDVRTGESLRRKKWL